MRKNKPHKGILTAALVLIVVTTIIVVLTDKSLKQPAPPKPDALPNQQTLNQQPSQTSPVESTKKTYQNEEFTFDYSPQLEMHESTSSAISWFEQGSNFSMELLRQPMPFPKDPQVDNPINNSQIKIERDKEFTISKNKVRDLVYGCGDNCLYHELHIQTGQNYYRLKAATSPNLEPKFQQIIASLKFLN